MANRIDPDSRERIYTASAGQVVFDVPFRFQRETDLTFSKLGGTAFVPLVHPEDFTVGGAGEDAGGIITLATAAEAGDVFRLLGAASIDRQTSIAAAGRFGSRLIDGELDRRVLIEQETRRDLDDVRVRALVAPHDETFARSLPAKADRALRAAAFDEDGEPARGPLITEIENAQAAAIAAEEAQSAAEKAQGLAEIAGADAQVAEAGAVTAQGKAEAAQAASETAEGKAETARQAAEAAEAASQTARTGSEVAQGAAETARDVAETAATTATTKAAEALASAGTASEAAAAAQTLYDNFDDRYLGVRAADPVADNDGDALREGSLYWNSTDKVMKVFDGAAWVAAYASMSGALLAANNLSDLTAPAIARQSLGVYSATQVDNALSAKAAKVHGHVIGDVDGLQDALDSKAPSARSIMAGTGLTGGGTLAADLTLSISASSQAQAELGTDNTTVMTPLTTAQAIAALGGNWAETPAVTLYQTARAYKVAHGLGALPKVWQCYARCRIAGAGYEVGNEILVASQSHYYNSWSMSSIWADEFEFGFAFNSSAAVAISGKKGGNAPYLGDQSGMYEVFWRYIA